MWTEEMRIPKKILQKWRKNYQEEDPNQIRKDIEIRNENWEEIQENRKWENRDGWRFLWK